MAITYSEAVGLLNVAASRLRSALNQDDEVVPLEDAIGRRASASVRSTQSTPEFDTSAMDGYAVNSQQARSASDANPMLFRVRGTMAAGDAPISVPTHLDEEQECFPPCVEIMTGARFPDMRGYSGFFDACIPIEHISLSRDGATGQAVIRVTRPAAPNQHRRKAGNDFTVDDVIIEQGEVVESKHIMALASTGETNIKVIRKCRIGVFSTGAELQPRIDKPSTRIPDVNRPYIISRLRSLGLEAEFVGSLDDSVEVIAAAIQRAVTSDKYDVLISTGAVSAGKFDFVRPAIERLQGRIVFHKVAMRPGHPVLFSMLGNSSPSSLGCRKGVAFFGLPGNPIATAVCLRFIVERYLQFTGCVAPDAFTLAKLVNNESSQKATRSQGPCDSRVVGKDEFRHGTVLQGDDSTAKTCLLSKDQSPAKAKPLLQGNCFIHIPPDFDGHDTDARLKCYPL